MTFVVVWMSLVACLWALILLKAVTSSKRGEHKVGPGDPSCDPELLVSVIIPARNEAHNIQAAVRAVLEQDHAKLELVVLDDGSTDGTGDLVRAFGDRRVRIIEGGGGALPEGWLGKPWACQRAGQQATGAWLLFIDADVRLAPEAVSRAIAYAEAHELDALSGFGQLEMVSFAERVLQPVIAGLLLAGNDLKDVNDPEKPDKALANGQFLLFRRAGYEAVGGHEAVRGNVLDDVGMALALKGAKVPYQLVFMRALFRCRMYASGAEVWAGWRKNLFPGLRWSWLNLGALLLGHTLIVLGPYTVLTLALVGLLPADVLPASLVAVLCIQAVRAYLDGVFEQERWIGLLTHGIANWLLAFLLLDSAVATSRGTATWKGRQLPTK